MSSAFYKTIIEDEIKTFGIKEESLKGAAKSVMGTYSRNSLNQGKTFLDYNIPSNRCAYLYKYASIHTGLVTKYFNELIRVKEIKESLKKKDTLKICCLGGGPGTDIVGLFKVLSSFKTHHKKVVEVIILDICGGWRNSFKRIISNLTNGKIKDVPNTFVDASNFKFKLIEVNLLNKLPPNIVSIISEADIICMVKFVSAILGSSTSVSALQIIGEKLKIGAMVLFIDNFQGSVFQPLVDISGKIGLKIVLGPIHTNFSTLKKIKGSITSNEMKKFGCLPCSVTKVTVVGFIKCNQVCNNKSVCMPTKKVGENDEEEDDGWATEDESEISIKDNTKIQYCVSKQGLNKFTQTNKKYFKGIGIPGETAIGAVTANDLNSLVDRLCDLVNVLSIWKQQMTSKKKCCHCH